MLLIHNKLSLFFIVIIALHFCNCSFQEFLIDLSKDPLFSLNGINSIYFLSEDDEYSHIWRIHDLFIANIPCNIISETHFLDKNVEICLEGTLIVQIGKFNSVPSVRGIEKWFSLKYSSSCLWLIKNGTQLDASQLSLNSQVYSYQIMQEESLITIEEIYSIKSITQMKNVILEWPKQSTSIHFWDRRSDFHGITLRHAVLEWKGYLDKVLDGEQMWVGTLKEVVTYLMEKMNFKTLYYEPVDCQWGLQMENGSWTGLVKELIDGKADFATGMTVLYERQKYIDYTFELYHQVQTIMMLRGKGPAVNWNAFISIFSVDAWKGFFGVFAIILGGYVMISNMSLWDSLALISLQIVQRAFTVNTEKLSTKVLYLSSCIFGFLFFTYYTAVLTSLMTATPPEPLISSFEDINNRNLDVFVHQGTSSESFLSGASQRSSIYEVYQRLKSSNHYVHSSDEEREKLIEGKLVFGSVSSILGLEESMIALDMVESDTFSVAFGLPQQSEFKDIFNYHILKLHETGIYDQMHHLHYFKRKPLMKMQQNAQEAIGLGYPNLLFPFMVIVLGISCSLMLCVPFEHIFAKVKKFKKA